jgi:ribosomal protein S1
VVDEEWAAMRERRRPSDAEWAAIVERFSSGVLVSGTVLSHHIFGFFLDLGDPAIGPVEIPRVRDPGDAVSPADYPAVGSTVSAVALGGNDLQRQVHLTIRPMDLEAATG